MKLWAWSHPDGICVLVVGWWKPSSLSPPCKNSPRCHPSWFLHWEGLLQEGRTTHSSIHVWRISCTEEPGGLWSMGSQRVRHNWGDSTYTQKDAETVWEFTKKASSLCKERSSPRTELASTLALGFPASRTVRYKCLHLSHLAYSVFVIAAWNDQDNKKMLCCFKLLRL